MTKLLITHEGTIIPPKTKDGPDVVVEQETAEKAVYLRFIYCSS